MGTALTVLPLDAFIGSRKGPSDARDGEYIQAGQFGFGDLASDHTDEHAPDDMRGKADAVDVTAVTPAWVIQRLYKEATDFGTRTRQSSRVKALELLGKNLSMFTEVVEHRDPVREALKDLDPWERKQRILELSQQLINDPDFAAKVAAAAKAA